MPTSSLTGQTIGPYRPLPGTAPQSGAGAFGKVPTVPDPTSTQGGVIQGNMANLANLYGLTGSLNTEIAKQAALPFQLNLPNYQQNIGQESKNTTGLLQGQIPQDVANQLAQQAAERGIATGSIGSPNANAALMRALGVTSLGLQQQGAQNLSQQIAQTPTGQQFNPASFLVTPAEQQEAAYLASLYAAAPSPGAGQRANLNSFLQGLGGLGGPGGVRGGGGGAPPGVDFFGNVYTNNEPGGVVVGGSLGWPGGAQSGEFNAPGSPGAAAAWNTWNQGMPWNQNSDILGQGWQGNPSSWLDQLNQDMGGVGADMAAIEPSSIDAGLSGGWM